MKSLAFRQHEAAIRAGCPPSKYTRLLDYIPRGRILEAGSAEGVLALLLAKRGDQVTAIEKSVERHDTAHDLRDEWKARGLLPDEPDICYVSGDALTAIRIFEDGIFDAFVAIRAVYYFGDELDEIFAEVARKAPVVVLCGNKNRAARWRAGTPDEPLGDFNRYAAREGMVELLTRHGYQIIDECREGDEIVVGKRA